MAPKDSDIAAFTRMIEALSQKMDALIRDKVDMGYYRDRHEELEKRVDKIEQRVGDIDEKVNSLHNNSMAWVNEALAAQTRDLTTSVQNVERRIFDKIEERATFSRSQWMLIIVAGVGWLISIGGLLVSIFK